MLNDPIVEEILRFREAHAESKNFDLKAIFQELKAEEKASGRAFVRLSTREPYQAKRLKAEPSRTLDPINDSKLDEEFAECLKEVEREDWFRTAMYEGWNTENGGCI